MLFRVNCPMDNGHAFLLHVTVPADYGDDNADGVDDDEDEDVDD